MFVSSTCHVFLQMLSQGSDPVSVQPYYEKIFDAIDKVVHNRRDVRSITHMRTLMGRDVEEIPLLTPVRAGS